MSFFRNIRTSITRGKSSSRDTTPVRTVSVTSSRPGSIVSNAASTASRSAAERRRDSLDSDSVFNRSETFILASDQEEKNQSQCNSNSNSNSNSSTLEKKKSKKSKVLSKFSTFTKRKKTPQLDGNSGVGGTIGSSFEHHPSDNATNTYYKWNTDGSAYNADYDPQSDPFNFLYEQHSNLKLLQNGIEATDHRNGTRQQNGNGLIDSSTYRKGKATTQLKAQLEQLKTQQSTTSPDLHEEEQDADSDKYKTVTLSSFRKSFRDKYLQQQKDAPYNPAWFVEVEKPQEQQSDDAQNDFIAKESRPEYLVFENDNYRPGSRSPVRSERNSRSLTRSPVKRNETFRVERSTLEPSAFSAATTAAVDRSKTSSPPPSIRVEIKNSVMPRSTARLVPVGVAKPMLSPNTPSYYRTMATPALAPYATPTNTAIKAASKNPISRLGRYQTLVQISNENHAPPTAGPHKLASSSTENRHLNRSTSTRIQFGDGGNVNSPSTILPKYSNNSARTRYSYAAPTTPLSTSTGLSSYELLKSPSSAVVAPTTKPPKLRHTYFGGDMNSSSTTSPPTRLVMSPRNRTLSGLTNLGNSNNVSSTTTNTGSISISNKLRQQSNSPNRSTITTTMLAVGGGTVPSAAAHMNRRDLHQPRYMVPMQRRSRSPIKIPWR